jgi:hypothetical protein
MIHSLYKTLFDDYLLELSLDSAANFAVQRLLERLTLPEDVSSAVLLLRFTQELIGKFRNSC